MAMNGPRPTAASQINRNSTGADSTTERLEDTFFCCLTSILFREARGSMLRKMLLLDTFGNSFGPARSPKGWISVSLPQGKMLESDPVDIRSSYERGCKNFSVRKYFS